MVYTQKLCTRTTDFHRLPVRANCNCIKEEVGGVEETETTMCLWVNEQLFDAAIIPIYGWIYLQNKFVTCMHK